MNYWHKIHYGKDTGQNNSMNQKGTFFLNGRYSLFVTSKVYPVASM